MHGLVTLKARREFLRIRGGRRYSSDAFLLEGKLRADDQAIAGQDADKAKPSQIAVGPRFGLTITKKIGNAVTRNRIRRRLKSALSAQLVASDPVLNCDYVIVARKAAEHKPFAELADDLKRAISHVNRALLQRDGGRK
ncbi:MAG: ribonuclease P protein component [Pseudomonadota bacterium]